MKKFLSFIHALTLTMTVFLSCDKSIYNELFTKDLYTVTFDSQGGSSVASQVVNNGALVTQPADPVYDSPFLGWYREPGCITPWEFTTDTVTADITLYAKWTTDTWMIMTPMPTARSGLGAAVVNGKIYAIGGTSGGYLSTVEEYDPATDTWAVKTPMPTPRAYLSAVAVNGKIYAIGGMDSGGYFSTVEEYDPASDTWAVKTPMPTARRNCGAAAVDGKIYVYGGYDGSDLNGLNILEVYDPGTDTWDTSRTDSLHKRYGAPGAAVNNKIYFTGGRDQPQAYAESQVYDTTTDTWTDIAVLMYPSYYHAGAALNGYVYSFGGFFGTQLADVMRYDPVNDIWAAMAALPSARCRHAAVVLNGRIYIIGGEPVTDILLKYIPPP